MPRFSFCRKWIWQSSLILTLLGGSVLPGKGECLSDSTSNRLRASTIPSLYNERDRTHDSLFLSATSLYLTGKEKEAEDAYLRLLEKDPENATAAFQIANILAERKNLRHERIVRVQVVRQPGGHDVNGTRVAVYPHRLAIVQAGADDVG